MNFNYQSSDFKIVQDFVKEIMNFFPFFLEHSPRL